MTDERPIEGSIWERNDELFIVERVYGAHEAVPASEGTAIPTRAVVLVKHRCIRPMPNHSRLDKFIEFYHPYDPERDE